MSASGKSPDNSKLHQLPPQLLAESGKRWHCWFFGHNGAKVPVTASIIYTGRDSSRIMSANAEDALSDTKKYTRGLAMQAGQRADAGMRFVTVLDLDYKTYSGAYHDYNGVSIPWWTWGIVPSAQEAGAWVELSPSGKGLHIIFPATLLRHGKKWRMTREELLEIDPDADEDDIAAILNLQHDMFSEHTIGYVTMTGNHLHDDMAWEPNQEASTAWLAEFHRTHLLPDMLEQRRIAAEQAVKVEEYRVWAAANPGTTRDPDDVEGRLADAMRVPQFRDLWEKPGASGGSEDDWALLCRLAGVFGGNTEQMCAAFRQSGLYRNKHGESRRGFEDFLEYEAVRAVQAWDGRPFPDPALRNSQNTGPHRELEWPQEARQALLEAVSKLPGTPVAHKAMRALLGHLLSLLDSADTHHRTPGNMVALHTGGLTALALAVGGHTDTVKQRLQALAANGFLARCSFDNKGLNVLIAANYQDCLALNGGEPTPPEPEPNKPQRSKSSRRPAEDRMAPMPRPLANCQMTFNALLDGMKQPGEISERTGQDRGTVRRHIAQLVKLGLVNGRWVKPLVTGEDYQLRVDAEAHLTRGRTRNNRRDAKEAWLVGREEFKDKIAADRARREAERLEWQRSRVVEVPYPEPTAEEIAQWIQEAEDAGLNQVDSLIA